VIVPFIDRLIHVGVLPVPKGYNVVWNDLNAESDLEKAQKANMLTSALSAFVSGGIEQVMTFPDYLVRVWGWDEEEVAQIVASSLDQKAEEMMTMDPQMDERMQEAQIEQMTNPDLVPDNINTGDQHHYEAGSKDREAELEHERIISGQENGPPKPGDQPFPSNTDKIPPEMKKKGNR
jgi:hypothetical protein